MAGISEHFSSHMQELRQRVLVSFIAVCLCSAGAYYFSRDLAEVLLVPLFQAYPDLASLVYTNLTDAFFSYLKISILAGIIISFPVLLFQAWMYVAPGLHKKEKVTVLTVVFFATGLFMGGVLFSYQVVLPELLSFLMGFSRESLTPMPKFGAYLAFVARIALGFGLAFEIPFLMVAAIKTDLVSRQYFIDKRLHSYCAILLLAFLLTVGEPFTAVLLALPLCLLYEVGILVTKIFR